MASDSRTNAGVDHIATFCKMAIFEKPGEAIITLLSAGNLATTQSVLSLLRQRLNSEGPNLLNRASLYDAAVLVGSTLKEVIARDSEGQPPGIDFGCSLLLGGQIRGEAPRLFNIYPQGNFIEATPETPYFQIGESKYGKPIIDRVVRYDTPLQQAAKCVLISFDSTIRSNISVGLPVDLMICERDSLHPSVKRRFEEGDTYLGQIRQEWSNGLREVFARIPDPDWTAAGD